MSDIPPMDVTEDDLAISAQEEQDARLANPDLYRDEDELEEKKKPFPDLTGDGKVTQADILKGRGVELDEED